MRHTFLRRVYFPEGVFNALFPSLAVQQDVWEVMAMIFVWRKRLLHAD